MQFDGTNHQPGGIDIAHVLRKEFLDEFVLAFLQALHTKGHASEACNLLFGIAQCKMTQETLVIFIYLVTYDSLLFGKLTTDSLFETLDNLLQDGFIEHQCLTFHHRVDIATCKQFTRL